MFLFHLLIKKNKTTEERKWKNRLWQALFLCNEEEACVTDVSLVMKCQSSLRRRSPSVLQLLHAPLNTRVDHKTVIRTIYIYVHTHTDTHMYTRAHLYECVRSYKSGVTGAGNSLFTTMYLYYICLISGLRGIHISVVLKRKKKNSVVIAPFLFFIIFNLFSCSMDWCSSAWRWTAEVRGLCWGDGTGEADDAEPGSDWRGRRWAYSTEVTTSRWCRK